MSDTFFSTAPHWQWLIVLYFFIGGIAGGSFFIGALLDLFGEPRDRPVARLGYYVAFVGAVLSGIILVVDLDRPERFWHMLMQSQRGGLLFKYWSPMSVGAWGLLIFGAFATLATLKALGEEGRIRWALLQVLRGQVTKVIIAILGGLTGFFLAGYTGVLLSVTNRPIWADTNLIGLLFLLSGASTAAATLVLASLWRGNESKDAVHWLSQFDTAVLVLELLALLALVVSLGSVARLWLNAWGVLLFVGVVLAGILLPLTLHWRPRLLGNLNVPMAAALVLVGGFLLRVVIILSSEGI